MRPKTRRVIATVSIVALLVVSFAQPALAQNPSVKQIHPTGEAMTADLVLLRPVGLIGMAAGACVWVLSLPFSLLGDNVGEATDELIKKPASYTFTRPLGSL